MVGADNEETFVQIDTIGVTLSVALCDLDPTVARLKRFSTGQHQFR